MSGCSNCGGNFDLTKLIFRGISALENAKVVPSYIVSSNAKTTQSTIVWMQDQDILLAKETYNYKFKSLSRARMAVQTSGMITYDLLDEQLLMYLTELFANFSSKRDSVVDQIQDFINVSLDPSRRDNLVKLRSLIEAIDSIRLDNDCKRKAFKQFLDKDWFFLPVGLCKFNAHARRLGLYTQSLSSCHYATLDNMLEQMIIAVDTDRGGLPEHTVDYVKSIEKFILLPLSEAIKPIVDPHGAVKGGDLFYTTFYKIVSQENILDNRQCFFGSTWRLTA